MPCWCCWRSAQVRFLSARVWGARNGVRRLNSTKWPLALRSVQQSQQGESPEPRTEHRREPIRELHLRPIAAILDWRKQRKLWASVLPHGHRDASDNRGRYTSPTDRGARCSRMP